MITEISMNMEACSTKLRNLKGRLSSLVNSTEEEFLAIGKDLQDFHRRAEKMSGISAETVGLVSGDDISRAIDGLKEMLGRMDIYLKRSDEEFSQIDRMLRYNVSILEYIINTLRDFEKIVKNLRILSINTKILSADLGPAGEGFRNLAEDVKDLARTMEESARLVLVQSGVLTENIRHALSSIAGIKKRQGELSQIILRNAVSTLSSLMEKQGHSSDAAARISVLSRNISQNTGNILVSLQFHDISRQRVEHVMEAVNDLCQRIEWGLRKDALLSERSVIASSAKNICKLQAAQLDNAGEELLTSIDGVIKNLRVILNDVGEMAGETVKMTGTTDETDSSFLSDMEKGINTVTSFLFDSLTECSKIGNELSSMMETIVGTLSNIDSFVDNIEGIGTEIELLAFNARIKSAHTGERGLGLSVIAEAIQAMSEDVCQKTIDVSETLKGMVNAINDLKVGIEAVSGHRDAEVEGMISELGRLRDSLHAVNGSISALITTLTPLAAELAEDIKRTINGISVHKLVVAEIEACVSVLVKISDSMSGISAKEGSFDNEAYRNIESRYTMCSERSIHLLHVDSRAKASNDLFSHEIAGDKSGNVELFR